MAEKSYLTKSSRNIRSPTAGHGSISIKSESKRRGSPMSNSSSKSINFSKISERNLESLKRMSKEHLMILLDGIDKLEGSWNQQKVINTLKVMS